MKRIQFYLTESEAEEFYKWKWKNNAESDYEAAKFLVLMGIRHGNFDNPKQAADPTGLSLLSPQQEMKQPSNVSNNSETKPKPSGKPQPKSEPPEDTATKKKNENSKLLQNIATQLRKDSNSGEE